MKLPSLHNFGFDRHILIIYLEGNIISTRTIIGRYLSTQTGYMDETMNIYGIEYFNYVSDNSFLFGRYMFVTQRIREHVFFVFDNSLPIKG